ncbi:MAG: IS200/IS605 family element transposase accessory protein TnpB [Candidatus Lokiarchaeota archaeon]|nr:IS200/IS605 family element transposase accessory protein TnpB [Candidatus Lokiarchaeota archaeon]
MAQIIRSVKFQIYMDSKLEQQIKETLYYYKEVVRYILKTIKRYKNCLIPWKVKGQKQWNKLKDWLYTKYGLNAIEYLINSVKKTKNREGRNAIKDLKKNFPTMPKLPRDTRRSCINVAIGLFKGYRFHYEAVRIAREIIPLYHILCTVQNLVSPREFRISHVMRVYRSKHRIPKNTWNAVYQKIKKYFKKGILNPPRFPAAPAVLEIYKERITKEYGEYCVKVPLVAGNKFRKRTIYLKGFGYAHKFFNTWAQKSLMLLHNGEIFVQGVFFKNAPKTKLKRPHHMIGVDLNYATNLATVAILSEKNKVKSSFIRGFAKERISRSRGKKKGRIIADFSHKTAKEIVSIARRNNGWIVLEKLEFKNTLKKRGKYHDWSYGQIISLIKEKALLEGIPVMQVNPKGTSYTHWYCGSTDTVRDRKKSLLYCNICNKNICDHLNSALNLAKIGWQRISDFPVIT